MKATLEKIVPEFGNSFHYENFTKTHLNKPPVWHYHPEIEIVFVNGGAGKRQIGSHLSYYHNGALLIMGSNVPHCGFTDQLTGNRNETIIQILPDFMGAHFLDVPEIQPIAELFQRAKQGIDFYGKTKERIGKEIEKLKEVSSFDRLLGLLSLLHTLATSEEYTILNAEGFTLETSLQDHNRINVIFNFVQEEFVRAIHVSEVAELVSMSVPGFCRYFKKITNKTFVQFVNEYRLVHATKLLHEQQISITDICFESGFSNFSHFSKLFKKFTGKTPSTYRNELHYNLSSS